MGARNRSAAIACAVLAILYLNELWLAPFGVRTTLDLLRGLSVLAIPVAAAAGILLARDRRIAVAAVAGSAIIAAAATLWVVPETCVSKPVDLATVSTLSVDRCQFRWRRASPRATRPQAAVLGGSSELAQIGTDRVRMGSLEREGAAQ